MGDASELDSIRDVRAEGIVAREGKREETDLRRGSGQRVW
jgi:hypothetical protein